MTEPVAGAENPGPPSGVSHTKPKVEPLGDGWQVVLYIGDVVVGRSDVFETKAAAQRAAREIA